MSKKRIDRRVSPSSTGRPDICRTDDDQRKTAAYSIHHPHSVNRPLPYFHPTRAVFVPHAQSTDEGSVEGDSELQRAPSKHWSSRASRKNRYARRPIHVASRSALKSQRLGGTSLAPKELTLIEQRVRHSESQFKVHLTWDISFWVAVLFVLGSAVWVVNGFFLFLPLVNIGSEDFPASAWSAFVGGTLFELGSYLMYVEALNTGHEQLFGPAVRELLVHANGTPSESPSPGPDSASAEKGLTGSGDSGRRRLSFRWLFPDDPPKAVTDVFFWTPQVVGGSGFIISSLLLMIEVQKKWWLPNLRSLGWHIGFWNLVGAVGFTLCGALGYASLSSSGAVEQPVATLEYKEAFALFDKKGTGAVPREVLGDLLRALGQNPTQAEVADIVAGAPREDGFKPAGTPEEFIRGFQVFDKEGNGFIGAGELRYVLTQLGEKMTDEEVDELLKGAQIGPDGTVNYESFVRTILSQ
ncbi:hypothetical protein ONZ51_g12764 [Trametes cubensis]|uniref:EF-hand domain-containing protein n=1 Tax=Trametes cubensis TaxID=1111947 RepID=A0AAD7X4M4_9APHY|nr:hypothetical protein ONZ51_g12764 [Trametes cubensis]